MENYEEIGWLRAIIIEDNALVHTAKLTQAYHAAYGMVRI